MFRLALLAQLALTAAIDAGLRERRVAELAELAARRLCLRGDLW